MDSKILTRVRAIGLGALAAGCGMDAAFDRATEYSGGASITEADASTSASTSASTFTSSASSPGSSPTSPGAHTATESNSESMSTWDATDGETNATATGDASAATEASSATGASSAETGDASEPPKIVKFTVTPNPVEMVGAVAIELEGEGDVVGLELLVDGKLIAEGPGAMLAATYEALSSVSNGMHTVTARALGIGGPAEDSIIFKQKVPTGGVPVWTAAVVPDGAASVGARIALYGEYTFVTGTELVAGKSRLLVRCYAGAALVWSTTIDAWTDLAVAIDKPSGGVDIEVNAAGILVAGNIYIDGRPRRYHARLTHAGDLFDERIGNPNEFVSGLGLASDGKYVLAGGVFEKVKGPPTDVAWWSFGPDGKALAAPTWTSGEGQSEDTAAAVAFDEATGDIFLAGHTQVFDENNALRRRQLVLKYTVYGLPLAEFISSGGCEAEETAAAVVATPDGPCIAGASGVGDAQHAIVRCLTDGLAPRWERCEEKISAAYDIDRNRAGLIIVAGMEKGMESRNARVAAIRQDLPHGAPLWSFEFPNPDGQTDEARGVRCDPWGRCRWTGWQSAGGSYLVVGELSP